MAKPEFQDALNLYQNSRRLTWQSSLKDERTQSIIKYRDMIDEARAAVKERPDCEQLTKEYTKVCLEFAEWRDEFEKQLHQTQATLVMLEHQEAKALQQRPSVKDGQLRAGVSRYIVDVEVPGSPTVEKESHRTQTHTYEFDPDLESRGKRSRLTPSSWE